MAWTATWHSFSNDGIQSFGPPSDSEGVLALRVGSRRWVWVEHSGSLRRRLYELLQGNDDCLKVFPHLDFSFELLAEEAASECARALHAEFQPACPRQQ